MGIEWKICDAILRDIYRMRISTVRVIGWSALPQRISNSINFSIEKKTSDSVRGNPNHRRSYSIIDESNILLNPGDPTRRDFFESAESQSFKTIRFHRFLDSYPSSRERIPECREILRRSPRQVRTFRFSSGADQRSALWSLENRSTTWEWSPRTSPDQYLRTILPRTRSSANDLHRISSSIQTKPTVPCRYFTRCSPVRSAGSLNVNWLFRLSKYLVVPQPLQCEAVLPTLQSVVCKRWFPLFLRRTRSFWSPRF